MDTPFITWLCIVGLFLLILSARFIAAIKHRRGSRHFIELGSEREEFFLPGDPLSDEDDYDC